MSSNQFNGLMMPVFTAFGWAGEETAVNFALSQMELFIEGIYYSLPRVTQDQFVVHGIDRASQSAYLSTTPDPEAGLIVASESIDGDTGDTPPAEDDHAQAVARAAEFLDDYVRFVDGHPESAAIRAEARALKVRIAGSGLSAPPAILLLLRTPQDG